MSKRTFRPILVFFILVIPLLVSFPLEVVLAQANKQCGKEASIDINGEFWSFIKSADAYSLAPISIRKNSLEIESSRKISLTQIHLPTFSFDQTVIQNGTAFAVLQQPTDSKRRDDFKTLNIVARNGQVISPEKDQQLESLHWWRLLPGQDNNHFGIFGYDDETKAFIVEVTYSAKGLAIGQPQYLPFDFYPMDFYWAMLSISPDWKYIGYVQKNQSGKLEFFIYSTADKRFIWQTPYDGDGFINVIWGEDPIISIVSGTTKETSHQLIGINKAGKNELLTDLSAIYGEKISILGLVGTTLPSDEVAFMVSSQQSNTKQLALLNLVTRQITDLCYTVQSAPILLGTDTDNIILQEFEPKRIAVISTQTGNYNYISLNDSIGVLRNTFKADNRDEKP